MCERAVPGGRHPVRAAMIANVGGTRDFRRRRRRTARNQFRLSRPAKLSRVSAPPTVAARFTPRDTEANARRDRSGATRRIPSRLDAWRLCSAAGRGAPRAWRATCKTSPRSARPTRSSRRSSRSGASRRGGAPGRTRRTEARPRRASRSSRRARRASRNAGEMRASPPRRATAEGGPVRCSFAAC